MHWFVKYNPETPLNSLLQFRCYNLLGGKRKYRKLMPNFRITLTNKPNSIQYLWCFQNVAATLFGKNRRNRCKFFVGVCESVGFDVFRRRRIIRKPLPNFRMRFNHKRNSNWVEVMVLRLCLNRPAGRRWPWPPTRPGTTRGGRRTPLWRRPPECTCGRNYDEEQRDAGGP